MIKWKHDPFPMFDHLCSTVEKLGGGSQTRLVCSTVRCSVQNPSTCLIIDAGLWRNICIDMIVYDQSWNIHEQFHPDFTIAKIIGITYLYTSIIRPKWHAAVIVIFGVELHKKYEIAHRLICLSCVLQICLSWKEPAYFNNATQDKQCCALFCDTINSKKPYSFPLNRLY